MVRHHVVSCQRIQAGSHRRIRETETGRDITTNKKRIITTEHDTYGEKPRALPWH
jgi:hypothetical protein